MTNKERLILEDNFEVSECDDSIELETWTNGGVNMFICLDKTSDETITEQFRNYVDNFNIDEEIDLHREGKEYRNNFTISESIDDFRNYLKWLQHILIDLEDDSTDIECLCKKYDFRTLYNLYVDDFDYTQDTLVIMQLLREDVLKKFLIGKFETSYELEELREKLNERL